jgi:hypothetical protein
MNCVVMTNFRVATYFSLIHLCYRLKRNGSVLVITSESFLNNFDYGETLPYWNKYIKVNILKILFHVIILKSEKTINIVNDDKVGIDSSLKSITCDSMACEDKYPDLYKNLENLCYGGLEVVEYLKSIKNHKHVFLFNGRGACQFPIAKYCYDNSIKISYLEYANIGYSGYKVFPFAPHASPLIGKELVLFRQLYDFDSVYMKNLVTNEINSKLSNVFATKYSQAPIEREYNVVVFLGSDHEYTGLHPGISHMKYFGNLALCEYAYRKYSENNKIAVRAHPNALNDLSYKEISFHIEEYCRDNDIKYYGPEDNISSHALIQQANVTVVEYSSIAYDSIYLGVSVDIFGDMALKNILESAPYKVINDKNLLSKYVAETMVIERDLFFSRFNVIVQILCRIFESLESRLLYNKIKY